MASNYYKVFFTISFLYKIDSKKKISKSFKSDIDINEKLILQEKSISGLFFLDNVEIK